MSPSCHGNMIMVTAVCMYDTLLWCFLLHINAGVEVVKTDMNLTGEELHALQTVSGDDTVWQMVGVTRVGKSLLGNFLLEKNESVVQDGDAGSMTDKFQVGCSVLNSQRLCIVDTPGCFDTQNVETEILANDVAHLAAYLSKTILMARHGIHAFLVVVRADVTELVSTTMLLDQFGIIGNFWNHTIVVFTHGKRFDETSEDKKHPALEATLNSPTNCPEDWKTLIEKAGKRYVIVESKERRDDKEYHNRKVEEFIKHSSAIVSSHGPYNDALLSLVRVHIENAKLELRHDFSNVDSPEAQVAALQIAFPKIKSSLHKIICIKLAGGDDVEAKEEELLEAHRRNSQLHQQVLKEEAEKRKAQEEQRKAQEAEDRAREAQRVAEEQARVACEAAEKARREVEEYRKKPTFEEMVVEIHVSSGNFHNWKWVYTAEAVDVATGITAKGKNYKSKDDAKKHARINLKAILLEKGIIRKD